MMLSLFDLIPLILVCSSASIGFYAACQFDGDEEFDKANKSIKKHWPEPEDDSKMVLWWVRYYIGRHISYYYSKPLYSCIICMGSVHSIVPVILFQWYYGIQWHWFFLLWPFIALSTAGLNFNITKWWEKQ